MNKAARMERAAMVCCSDVEGKIGKIKEKIRVFIAKKDFEASLALISCCAEIQYVYNQKYVDDELELLTCELRKMKPCSEMETDYVVNNGVVLFYDGFGFDTRGLALIYLRALDELGYRICYVVNERAKGNIPLITSVVGENNIVFISQNSYEIKFRQICNAFFEARPMVAFLYTGPDDVSGILAFMHMDKNVSRYLINLTDHAFWLGKNSFDFELEFRDYGASISNKYREIEKSKIIKLPYYPVINRNVEFEGFPFKKKETDIVLFSGGALYKTIDVENNFFYKMIRYCLEDYENTIFWYAGSGDTREIDNLVKDFPGRVFLTSERNDLFQVLQNIDIYVNTYPMVGGLMMQYSAMAGKPPITLRHGDEGKGILINQEQLNIEYDCFSGAVRELGRLIEDSPYRCKRAHEIRNAVITEQDFRENLEMAISQKKNEYEIDFSPIDTSELMKQYKKRFGKYGVERIVAKKRYKIICSRWPLFYVKCGVRKVIHKKEK